MNPNVTLVGGFLGAGKTSLLHHFLSEHATEPVALFIDQAGPVNFDAKAMRGLCGVMRRSRDRVEEIPAENESDWWKKKWQEIKGEYREILIEVSGTTNGARLRPFFGEGAQVRIVCVVDALDFYRGVVLPSQRGMPVAFLDFLRSQIVDATHLVLNKCDLVGQPERSACIDMLRGLNSGAVLIETAYGELPEEFWSKSPVLSSLDSCSGESPAAEPVELTATFYRAYRPFHPERFAAWFEAEHPGLLRVKGIVWLATRNLLVGGISRTRWQNSCGGAGIWWAALPREEWPDEPEALARLRETWREPYGDRRQELLLIGEKARLPAVARQLEACLLTAEEYARPLGEWTLWPDPFPEWDVD
jgi:G3E family GTPase